MKVGSLKGFAMLTGVLLVGLALTPFVQSFNGRKGIL
jgi:hypothetical protein